MDLSVDTELSDGEALSLMVFEAGGAVNNDLETN